MASEKVFINVLPGLHGIKESFAAIRAEGSDSLKRVRRRFCYYGIIKGVNVNSEEK